MATNTIKFIQLSQNKYLFLTSEGSLSASTIYFTSDTKRIYKGADFYSNNISVSNSIPEKNNAILNVLYIDSTTGAMSVKYNGLMLNLASDILDKAASLASAYTDNSISNLHNTITGLIQAAASLASAYTDNKINALGKVFELKGYADEDHTKTPWDESVSINDLLSGDVYLVDLTDSQGITRTVLYVCVSSPAANEDVSSSNFQRMGVSSSATEYVTFNYVEQKFSLNSASISSLNSTASNYANSLYSLNSQSLSTFKEELQVLDSENKIATFKSDGYVQSSGKIAGNDNSSLTGLNTLAAEKAVKTYVDSEMSLASSYVDNSIDSVASALSSYVDSSIVWDIIED